MYVAESEKEGERLATGEPIAKKVRLDVKGDPVMTKPAAQPLRLTHSVSRRLPILNTQNANPGKKKKKVRKAKVSRKSIVKHGKWNKRECSKGCL